MELQAFLWAISLISKYIGDQKRFCLYNRGWLLDHASCIIHLHRVLAEITTSMGSEHHGQLDGPTDLTAKL